jgi:multiple sugar transport system permease protein
MATTQADVDFGAESTKPSSGAANERRIVGQRVFSLKNLAGYIFLIVITIYCLTPLYWLAIAATKNNTDLFNSFGLWFADFNLVANIEQLFTREGGIYLHWIANSALYAGVGGALGTLISVAAGYALAKYQFFGRGFLTALILGAVLVPQTTIALPLYLLISKVNLINTYWAVLLPSLLFPIGVYLARVYTNAAVPNELIDAARVDGAGELRIFGRVAMPLLLPGMVTIFLFQFVAIWNNFFLPFVVLNDPNYYPVNVGLATWNFDPAAHELLFNLIVTGSFLAVLPLIALFLFLQRYWRAGLAFGGVIG